MAYLPSLIGLHLRYTKAYAWSWFSCTLALSAAFSTLTDCLLLPELSGDSRYIVLECIVAAVLQLCISNWIANACLRSIVVSLVFFAVPVRAHSSRGWARYDCTQQTEQPGGGRSNR